MMLSLVNYLQPSFVGSFVVLFFSTHTATCASRKMGLKFSLQGKRQRKFIIESRQDGEEVDMKMLMNFFLQLSALWVDRKFMEPFILAFHIINN